MTDDSPKAADQAEPSSTAQPTDPASQAPLQPEPTPAADGAPAEPQQEQPEASGSEPPAEPIQEPPVPEDAVTPAAPQAEPATPPPVIHSTTIQKGDVWIMAAAAGVAMTVLVAFGIALFLSGLISFPDMSVQDQATGYFTDALDYRERRNTLALILRTFVTGFSFVVGLALCTMGGLFILRQVTSLTTISGSLGANPLAAPPPETVGEGEATTVTAKVAKGLRETQFAFSAYSPGVVFLVGGVVVMVVTQYLAIEVKTIEVVPRVVVSSFCYDETKDVWKECGASEANPKPAEGEPPPEADTTPLPQRP